MKFYHYIPFYFVLMFVKMMKILSPDAEPGVRWKKYFGEGYTHENYLRFMDNMKNQDSQTYWLLLISPGVEYAPRTPAIKIR